MSDVKIFRELHHQPQPLVIANAWNVQSAQLIEKAGFKAVATSSGAIANSLGYPDGEKLPFNELLYIVGRIKANIGIPLSVDMERGYSDNLDQLNDNIQKLIDLGVAGINLEDAQGEAIYLPKLNSISNYLAKTGQDLHINARTDAFLQKLDEPLKTTLKRAKLYKDAGASSVFVTGVGDPDTIKEIASAIQLPMNVVGNPKLSSFAELAACGVKRISMAVLVYRSANSHIEKVLSEVIASNSLAPLF